MLPFLIIMIIILDQYTKYLVSIHLINQPAVVIIPNHLELVYLENSGAAFGILQNKHLLFILVTLAIIFIVSYFMIRNNRKLSNLSKIAMLFLMAGALGNFIDRIRYSYVIDFISLKFGGLFAFPIFNIADMAIVVGSIVLIRQVIFTKDFNDI